MTIVTIRPEPGAASTVRSGRERGLAIRAFPLSEIRPLSWDDPSAERFDALLIGSANVFRHGGPALQNYAHLPVHAVGKTTANIARGAGFRVELTGEGGLQELIDRADGPIRYLRLCGTRHVPLDAPAGVTITLRKVYASVALPAPEELACVLQEGALVLLHSASSAEHFAAECDRLGTDRSRVSIAALGPRIAAAAGSGWAARRSAVRPSEAALLALTAHMCH